MNQTDDKPTLYALTAQQLQAIRFALRNTAAWIDTNDMSAAIDLHSGDLLALAKELGQPGVVFCDVVPLFGEDASNPYVAAALGHVSEGELEVDVPAVVSRGDDPGAYVMAWIWITDEEAGVSPAAVTNDGATEDQGA
jgi:hypothetical protein